MKGDAAISWLMFFTLSAGVVVGAALLLSFLRSRHNREIAAYALEGDGRSQRGEPSGAAVELLALAAAAAIAMALLTVGYTSRGDMKVTPVNSSAANNELARPRTDPNTPKPYQPENPAPDSRAAVTGSSTGAGPDNGGRPEQEPSKR
jgi:NADH:ubiquinone oxidoreductase subunit K